jgi:hypothetical protein
MFQVLFLLILASWIKKSTKFKKICDTITGGSVLASEAQPPASVTNFFHSDWHTLRFEHLSCCTGNHYSSLCTLCRHLLHKRWAWPRRQASRWAFGPTRLFSLMPQFSPAKLNMTQHSPVYVSQQTIPSPVIFLWLSSFMSKMIKNW